jgi:ABC-type sugar transport system ATPase subunit
MKKDVIHPQVIEVVGLGKRFPGVVALDNFEFDLAAGEIHALVGENGAGKSTFIKLLAGAYSPDSGQIHINGQQVGIRSPKHAHELGMAFIHQGAQVVPQFSAAEEMTLGIVKARRFGILVDWAAANAAAKAVARRLGLDFSLRTPVWQLSAAQQQLIAIGRALLANARVLVLDEPTAPLAGSEVEKLFRLVKSLASEGVGVIYVSHRLDEVFELANRVTVLKDGVKVTTLPISEIHGKEHLVRLIVGRDLAEHFPVPAKKHPEESVLLRVRNLNWGRLVRDVSFDLHRGELVGMAGLVGAGRSEVAHVLFGSQTPDSGTMEIAGRTVRPKRPRDAIRAGLALLPEDRRAQGAILDMNVRENMTLASLPRYRVARWIPLLSLKKERRAAVDHMRVLRVRARGPEQPILQLSGGNQQKVIVAKWLSTDARILIFDEPTQGIDVGTKAEIYALMDRLAAEGRSVIFISSDLDELTRVCHRILVMREGRLVADLLGADESKVLAYCFGTEAATIANGDLKSDATHPAGSVRSVDGSGEPVRDDRVPN